MKTLALGLLCVAIAVPSAAQSTAELQKQAKITMDEAQRTALAKQSGKVKSGELEKEHGNLIYSFDIRTTSGIHEVQVDAVTGAVVSDQIESAAAEAKENANEHKAKHRNQGQKAPQSEPQR